LLDGGPMRHDTRSENADGARANHDKSARVEVSRVWGE
jgi:hypothetical protein